MVVESIDVLRLYSFKGDALSWSVRDCGTSGPPQRSYSQRNTVGVEACRRRGGGRGRRNRALGGTITTTNWLTPHLLFHNARNLWGNKFHHWVKLIITVELTFKRWVSFERESCFFVFFTNKCLKSLSFFLICTLRWADVRFFQNPTTCIAFTTREKSKFIDAQNQSLARSLANKKFYAISAVVRWFKYFHSLRFSFFALSSYSRALRQLFLRIFFFKWLKTTRTCPLSQECTFSPFAHQ